MYIAITLLILFILATIFIPHSSTGVVISLMIILSVLGVIIIIRRIVEIKKRNISEYDENELIIQNVKKGGVIKIANVEGKLEPLELKVIGRNLYMEGDYSWYELECIDANNEKYWIDIDNDDELIVSIVIEKPKKEDLKFSSSLEDIDENEKGSVKYKGDTYFYTDSGDAIFYKYCNDKYKELFYYWDFKRANGIISVERWKNPNGKSDTSYFFSQIIKPSSITVYSTHGENNK